MSKIKGYRDLVVWQKALSLTVECYQFSAGFPTSETYGLRLQLRKSAVSVPSNIAEGHGRRTTAEFIRFLNISYGSLCELQTQIRIAVLLGYSTSETGNEVLERTEEIARMLNGLRDSLGRNRKSSVPLNPES